MLRSADRVQRGTSGGLITWAGRDQRAFVEAGSAPVANKLAQSRERYLGKWTPLGVLFQVGVGVHQYAFLRHQLHLWGQKLNSKGPSPRVLASVWRREPAHSRGPARHEFPEAASRGRLQGPRRHLPRLSQVLRQAGHSL